MRFLFIIMMIFSINIYATGIQEKLDNKIMYLKETYKDNKKFINNLDESQKAWKIYIKKQMELKYNSSYITQGSVGMCRTNMYEHMIEKRIKELDDLENYSEGDVCNFYYLKDEDV